LTWWGERTSTPIVLLHGFLDTGATWQFLADHLPASWTLVAPDWRGFGDTEWAPGGYWFPDYFADLDVLLDLLVPQNRARVIGHSMGANIAKMYGGIRPRRLQWLVNLEGLGLVAARPDELRRRSAMPTGWMSCAILSSRGVMRRPPSWLRSCGCAIRV